MAQSQLHYQSPAQVTAHNAWDPEDTVQPADSSAGYRVSLPSALVGLNPFQAASLVSELS